MKSMERRNDRGANWVKITDMLTFPWRECYMYIDSAKGYEADGIFVKNGISVCFKNEQYYNGGKYCCVFCSVRKTDRGAFLSSMEELAKKASLKRKHGISRFLRRNYGYSGMCMNRRPDGGHVPTYNKGAGLSRAFYL